MPESTLVPLLMPSGPQWSEKWTEVEPPPLVHYDWHHYRVLWREYVVDRHAEWPRGAWVCELVDERTPLRRLHDRLLPGPPGIRPKQRAQAHREYCQDGGCVTMGWRFAIGPDFRPWEPGDQQPQDGHWPISIAVFGLAEVRRVDAVHVSRMYEVLS